MPSPEEVSQDISRGITREHANHESLDERFAQCAMKLGVQVVASKSDMYAGRLPTYASGWHSYIKHVLMERNAALIIQQGATATCVMSMRKPTGSC